MADIMKFDFILILSLTILEEELPEEVAYALNRLDISAICSRLLIVASDLQMACNKNDIDYQ